MKTNHRIILDNGGGLILQLGAWAHSYDGGKNASIAKRAATDILEWLRTGTTAGWEGHDEDALDVRPTGDEIRNGGYKVITIDRETDTAASLAAEVRWGAMGEALASALATTVTDGQISALRAEAGTAGDLEQVALCDAALAGDAAARAKCADAIQDAAAQGAGEDVERFEPARKAPSPSSPGLPPLKISPCTNCGSTGWTEVEPGVYERGCCTENGGQRPTFVVDAKYVKTGE